MTISWVFRSINRRLEPLITGCRYFDIRNCRVLCFQNWDFLTLEIHFIVFIASVRGMVMVPVEVVSLMA